MARTRGVAAIWLFAVASIPGIASGDLVRAASATTATVTVHELLATPLRIGGHADLSCPTSTNCVLAANPAARTFDGGATWAPFRLGPYDVGGLVTVDCATESVCAGFDGAGTLHRTLEGGRTWSQSYPTSVDSPTDISCPSALECIAGGQDLASKGALWRTTDGGDTWTLASLDTVTSDIRVVTCETVTNCVAASYALILRSTDGGASWTTVESAPAVLVNDVDCISSLTCIAIASQVTLISTDGGATWVPADVAPRRNRCFMTVFPCGEPRPNASNVNYLAGATVANAVIAKIGAAGDVCLFSSASTHLVVDVDGYVA